MRTRMVRLIWLALVFQILTAAAVLVFGGEFNNLKAYCYQSLLEQTDTYSAVLREELQQKADAVNSCAEVLNNTAADFLHQRGAAAAELQTDSALADSMLEASAELVSNLLLRTAADDAYLIINGNTGDAAEAVLYLHAADSGVPQKLSLDAAGGANADFYVTPMQTAQAQTGHTLHELGYWSDFSAVSSAVTSSMKYSLPLISEDGTVYGVLGVGLAEDTVLSCISSNLSDETACYVLGYRGTDDAYVIAAHAGSAYSTLLGNADSLRIIGKENTDISRFEMKTDAELLGNVQELSLYTAGSPYAERQWALISVADRSDILWPVLILKRMLLTAALLSLIAAGIVAVLGSGVIMKPLVELSQRIKTERKYNTLLRFAPTNIYEIDEITDAITQMQINVHGFSSQVSKMISVADVGVGTFMYDRRDDSVFVGQSLIKVLRLDLPQGEDITMTRREFLNSIRNPAVRLPISEGMEMPEDSMRKDFSKVHEIKRLSGDKLWIRLGFSYSADTAIGIVQDITDAVMEKNRIEYERDYDHLTGLLNRQAYYRAVERLFHEKSNLTLAAFIMIDLDNLKYVNDTYGHNFGDDYIKTAATALKKFQEFGGIVSRLSGDEFSICLPGFSSKDELREIISLVRSEMLSASCLLADGTHFKVNGSMGVSWYPDDSDSRELLMKYADFAMYTVKHATKGGIAEFDWDAYSADSVLLTGVEEMNRVIEERSVKYAFQSIVSAKTGQIYGYEALMRVQSEVFQSPLELLRTAKTGAKLYEIERLTWIKALEDFQALIDSEIIEPTAHVFINSIANNRLENEVEELLSDKYAPILSQIVVEILEGESSDAECTAHKAEVIRGWGGQFALDDFGTGYNSEYALLSYRPNIIKIDRTIINSCDRDADRRMIIENLVKLARTKNILVLAEGVETQKEMETVISCGVDFMQGYYLARPLFEPEPLAPELAEAIRRMAELGGV